MSPDTITDCRPTSSFPRVSGDEPEGMGWSLFGWMFSPRERG